MTLPPHIVSSPKALPSEYAIVEALPDTPEELISLISSPNGVPLEQRIQAISRLGDLLATDMKNARGLMCLFHCIQHDRNPQLVGHCISVLGRIKAYSAVMMIVDVTLSSRIDLYEAPDPPNFRESDDSLRLRCAAVQTLGRMGDERAIIPLISILNDKNENYRLRLAAAESLGKLGDAHAVTPLLDILTDDGENSIYLKESAAKALGMLGDIRALEPLITVLESKRGIRDKFNFLKEQIIEAISRIGSKSPKVTHSLLKVLKDETPSIRLAAVQALGELGDPQCLDILKLMLSDKDDDVALAAVAALFAVGGEGCIRAILDHQTDNLPQFLRDELESYIP